MTEQAEQFKLDKMQDVLESYIKHISDTYIDHGKCGLIISSLRSAADDIHAIRFDKSISEKFIEKEKAKANAETKTDVDPKKLRSMEWHKSGSK